MNIAGVVVFGTRKLGLGLGFHTTPVGAAGVGLVFDVAGLQAVLGTLPPGNGIFTCKVDAIAP